VTGDQIQIDGMEIYSYDGIQSVQFADGTVWSAQQLIELGRTVIGTAGADTLTGSSGADVFDGKGGNDIEVGKGGDDTFEYNTGYGHLEIQESDANASDVNVLKLGAGITLASLIGSSSGGGNLILTDGVTGDQIQLDNMVGNSGLTTTWGIQEIEFADGTTLDHEQIIELGTTGTSAADKMYGSADAEVFDGKGGNDVEYGDGGNDTFIYDTGYGHLEINEAWSTGSVLKLGTGISAATTVVKFDSNGNVILTDGVTGDQIQIDGMEIYSYDGIQSVQFADGTVWSAQQLIELATPITGTTSGQTLTGTAFSDIFDAKGSSDTEIGAGGNDTYMLQSGSGSLTIENGVSTNDVASGTLSILNESANDIWLKEVGNDLQVDIMGTQTEATIQGWFTNSYSQLNAITVSGSTGTTSILDSQLSQLVQAMATYSAQNPGFDPASSTNPAITDPNLLTLVNSSYHANL